MSPLPLKFAAIVRGVLLGLLATSALTSFSNAAFVNQSATEFTASGDFDGNGLSDGVVVERATGHYRLAYQQSPGSYVWAPVRPSGITNVSSLALGKLLSDTLDALAFTSPNANRINVLSSANPSAPAQPLAWFSPGLGPTHMAALDIGGTGNTARDDLFVGTTLNGLSANAFALMRNASGSGLTTIASGPVPDAFVNANPVRLKSNLPFHLGACLRTLPSDTFKAFELSSGTLVESAAITGLPARSDFVYGNFIAASPLTQFLFYHSSSNLLWLRPVQETLPGQFSFGAGATFDLGLPIEQVFTLAAQSGIVRLLIIFDHGQSARRYEFDGVNPPVASQSFTPSASENFTSAIIQPDGSFLLLSGAPGSGLSSRFQVHAWNGSAYAAGQQGTLPTLSLLSHTANVLHYSSDPFGTATARLLGQVNAGDWSSQYTLASGTVTTLAETFGGTTAGLQNPTSLSLGSPPSGTTFGLINQYRSEISLFSLSAAFGDTVADVTISPAPGEYGTSIAASLSSRAANVTLWYRVNGQGAWQSYSTPFWLFQNSTVSFYAQPNAGAASAKSAIQQARYTFSTSPNQLDSDGDGVPDYVEIAKGLDPVGSGNDSDHDGFFDLDELAHGFAPNNPNDHPPAAHPRLELHAAIDLIASPRPWDGFVQTASVASNGTAVQAFNLNGALLLANEVISNPAQTGTTTPSAVLSNLVVDTSLRLCVVGTEPHFDIVTPSSDHRIGRELLRLVDFNELSQSIQFPETWGNSLLNIEANLWIASVSNQLQSLSRLKLPVDVTVDDTLAALLVERKVQEILLSRGQVQYSNATLFPFRPADVQRSNPPTAELRALEHKLDAAHPGYSLPSLLNAVEARVFSTASAPAQLKALTRDIYRLSSASNNVPTNATNWPFFPSPVNSLREFIATGLLFSNYLARTAVSAANRTLAYQQARALLDEIAPRPLTNLTLVIRPDTFTGACTLLDNLGHTKVWSLLQADKAPYPLLAAFQLLPESRVSVTGYTDVTNGTCAAAGLEVLGSSLEFVPAVTPEDTDGDLLLDALELTLFGDLSQGTFGDADGDGYSNLEEQLAGSDLKNAASVPGTPKLIAGAPQIDVQPQAGGSGLLLSWSFPSAYSAKVQFQVLATPALGIPFNPSAFTPVETMPGVFQLSAPLALPAVQSQQFFQLQMKLK